MGAIWNLFEVIIGNFGTSNLGFGGGKFGNGSSQLGSLVETPQTSMLTIWRCLFGTLKPLKTLVVVQSLNICKCGMEFST